jgi:DNA-directed RNA polymerase specialized sigma24 family protein
VEDRPLDEPALIERAKRGDVAAYERIVSEHQTIAFRTAWTITGSAADAEEAAQDAFVNAYRALARFRSGAPFRPWLLRIVANEARNRRSAAGRRQRLAVRAGSAARTTRSRRPSRRSSAPNAAASCWQPSSASGRPTGR